MESFERSLLGLAVVHGGVPGDGDGGVVHDVGPVIAHVIHVPSGRDCVE